MKIGICDDNTEEREILLELCNESGYTDICIFPSGKDFLEIDEKPDLLFLDIEMQGMSGIELKNFMEQTTNHHTYIVFYTAHSEWMPEAFGKNVIGFLRKPVNLREVEHYIQKTVFLQKEYYCISLDSKRHLYCGQILYIQANGVYTNFVCKDNQHYSVRKPMQQWVNELTNLGFFSIHRSYIVNLKYIRNIDAQKLELETGEYLPISRRQVKYIKNAYQDYCISRLF